MGKVSVIGMDLADKNHKAVCLSESGQIVERCEVACTGEGLHAFLSRYPGVTLVMETGTHCRWIVT